MMSKAWNLPQHRRRVKHRADLDHSVPDVPNDIAVRDPDTSTQMHFTDENSLFPVLRTETPKPSGKRPFPGWFRTRSLPLPVTRVKSHEQLVSQIDSRRTE